MPNNELYSQTLPKIESRDHATETQSSACVQALFLHEKIECRSLMLGDVMMLQF